MYLPFLNSNIFVTSYPNSHDNYQNFRNSALRLLMNNLIVQINQLPSLVKIMRCHLLINDNVG